jgi:quercetin dioxygenase-like cupin family protein
VVEPIVVTDRPGRRLRIRLALDNVVMTESHYGAGERGPRPHVHRLHADCFYVIEGALTLSRIDGDHVFGPGAFVLIPPNVVHTFRNDGPAKVRFLNLHAPGMGFDRYVLEIGGAGEAFRAELAACYDQYPPPEGGGLDPASVLVRTAQTDAVSLSGVDVSFLANAKDTLGAIGLVEYTAPPSFPGPPAHLHERTWDATTSSKAGLPCVSVTSASSSGRVTWPQSLRAPCTGSPTHSTRLRASSTCTPPGDSRATSASWLPLSTAARATRR